MVVRCAASQLTLETRTEVSCQCMHTLCTQIRWKLGVCTRKEQEVEYCCAHWFMAFVAALSLCQDESTTQSRMLKAAEGIGHAMADLVQATADNCYM